MSKQIRCISGTLSSISSSTWSTIELSDEITKTVCIHRVILVRTSGSATTFYPTIKNTSTGTAGTATLIAL